MSGELEKTGPVALAPQWEGVVLPLSRRPSQEEMHALDDVLSLGLHPDLQAENVCHDEQVRIWSEEIVGALAQDGYFGDHLIYDDVVQVHTIVAEEIKRIVLSAFKHSELGRKSLSLVEQDILKAWKGVSIPWYDNAAGGDWWPRAGPDFIKAHRPVNLSSPVRHSHTEPNIAEEVPDPVIFTYQELRSPKWYGLRYAIYGECEGTKIQVDGPPWPVPK